MRCYAEQGKTQGDAYSVPVCGRQFIALKRAEMWAPDCYVVLQNLTALESFEDLVGMHI
jgi:hypothetical protein